MLLPAEALGDELQKIALLGGLWGRITDVFRGEKAKAQRRADYMFSPKAKGEKWRVVPRYAHSKAFVDAIQKHPQADEDLKLHVKSMHELGKGRVIGKIHSSKGAGKTYEVRKLPTGGKGCTCNDWRYRGSINPGYKCKHIRAFEAGMTKTAGMGPSTKAFTDEMEKILDARRAARLRHDDLTEGGGPWSNILLQDETPTEYTPPTPPLEPDIIMRQR